VPFVTTGQALLVLVLAVDTLLLAVLVRVTWADRWVGTAPGEGDELIDQALPGGVASAASTSARGGVSARRRARTGPPRR
jgi:hypothetical protein